jgi:hypothetical protein
MAQSLHVRPSIPTRSRRGISVSATPMSYSERLWRFFTMLRGQFLSFIVALLFLAALTALIVAQSASRAYNDLGALGQESIPSVDAAQTIASTLEDANARAANYLLPSSLTASAPCVLATTGLSIGTLTTHECDSRDIDADLALVNSELYSASATHSTAYRGERTAIEQTQLGLEEYVADIDLMRYEFAQATNNTLPSDPHMQQAYNAYKAATSVLYQQVVPPSAGYTLDAESVPLNLLPVCILNGQTFSPQQWTGGGIEQNVGCLSFIGKTHLDQAYQDTVKFVGISLGLIFGSCIYSCILLFWATWSMSATTHRLINPGLTLALLIALVFTGIALSDFNVMYGQRGDFAVIKNDYSLVYTVANVQRYSTAAQAAQERWLLALTFNNQPDAAIWQGEQAKDMQMATTLLRSIGQNVITPQADSLLLSMQRNWKTYQAASTQVDAAAHAGDAAAIAAADHLDSGQAEPAFRQFRASVLQFSQNTRADYSKAFTDTQGMFQLLTTWCALAFLLAGLIGAVGIAVRLREM